MTWSDGSWFSLSGLELNHLTIALITLAVFGSWSKTIQAQDPKPWVDVSGRDD